MSIDALARAAGFWKADEMQTSTANEKVADAFGCEVIGAPLMPDGWFALRTEKGALCVGPNGSFWVPSLYVQPPDATPPTDTPIEG